MVADCTIACAKRMAFFAGKLRPCEDVGRALDYSELVVEVVGDAAGQLAQRLHLLALTKLVLGLSALFDLLIQKHICLGKRLGAALAWSMKNRTRRGANYCEVNSSPQVKLRAHDHAHQLGGKLWHLQRIFASRGYLPWLAGGDHLASILAARPNVRNGSKAGDLTASELHFAPAIAIRGSEHLERRRASNGEDRRSTFDLVAALDVPALVR